MSLESSKSFHSRRVVPCTPHDIGHLRSGVQSFLTKAPYISNKPSVESARMLESGYYRDTEIEARSEFNHDRGLDARLKLYVGESRALLDIRTYPNIRGMWETPDDKLHENSDVFSELSSLVPDSPDMQKLLDIGEPSEADVHAAIQRLILGLGVRASVITSYDSPASVFSFVADESGFPYASSEYTSDTTVRLSHGEILDPRQKSKSSIDTLLVSSNIILEESAIIANEYAVFMQDRDKVGISMSGYDNRIADYVESARNNDIISNLLRRSEQANEYLEYLLKQKFRS